MKRGEHMADCINMCAAGDAGDDADDEAETRQRRSTGDEAAQRPRARGCGDELGRCGTDSHVRWGDNAGDEAATKRRRSRDEARATMRHRGRGGVDVETSGAARGQCRDEAGGERGRCCRDRARTMRRTAHKGTHAHIEQERDRLAPPKLHLCVGEGAWGSLPECPPRPIY